MSIPVTRLSSRLSCEISSGNLGRGRTGVGVGGPCRCRPVGDSSSQTRCVRRGFDLVTAIQIGDSSLTGQNVQNVQDPSAGIWEETMEEEENGRDFFFPLKQRRLH